MRTPTTGREGQQQALSSMLDPVRWQAAVGRDLAPEHAGRRSRPAAPPGARSYCGPMRHPAERTLGTSASWPIAVHSRLDQTYAAKTLGQLDDLLADQPGTDLSQLPGRPGESPPLPERRVPGKVQAPGVGHPAVWPFWLAVTMGMFVIWLISGASGGQRGHRRRLPGRRAPAVYPRDHGAVGGLHHHRPQSPRRTRDGRVRT